MSAPGSPVATVAQRLRQPLVVLANTRDPESFFVWFKFQSYQELGDLLGHFHPNGHGGRPFDRSHIYRLVTGERPVTEHTRQAFGILADHIIRARSGGRIWVRMETTARRWKLIAQARCPNCSRLFAPDRFDQVRCRRCSRVR